MIGSTARQPSLFYFAFHQQAALIKDDLLDPIDRLLEDPALIASVTLAMGGCHPRSATTGRTGIAPDRLLRSLVLKHLKGWSFRELEREVRASLVYRRFTRFDSDRIPDHVTFSRRCAALPPDIVGAIHLRTVVRAAQEDVAQGRKLRTDTTVVESNIHYPTDSALLADGIRVLTSALRTVARNCARRAIVVVDHARAAKRRVLEINRAAKSFTEQSRKRLVESYRKLLAMAVRVLGQAERVAADLRDGKLAVTGDGIRAVLGLVRLEHFAPLVRRVIAQAKARVFDGDTHHPDKVLSLFEPHTRAIRKGKAHKPTEFGRLVRIDEVEHGIVSAYEIKDGQPSDDKEWPLALDRHERVFGRAPYMATADRGYSSAQNVSLAQQRGVKRVALPARGPLSRRQVTVQKQRWFQRALRWRAGIEARIATLKNRFSMARARYKGDDGFKRYVGWCIIAHNLVSIARHRRRDEATEADDHRLAA